MTTQAIPDRDWYRLESCLGPDQVFPAQMRARVAGLGQAVAVVRWAGETGTRLHPLSRPGEAALLAADSPTTLALDLSGLASVRFYEPGDLTVGVEAGMTPQRLNQMLAEHGQFLPVDATRAEHRTLGSVLAAHASGPLRQQFGTVRDFTLGIEFVTAAGRIVHGGGQVVKNVAGYDLMKLQIGARGSLGLITSANFKLFPLPREPQTMQLALSGWAAADALRHELLHSVLRPLAVELTGPAPSRPGTAGGRRLRAALRFDGNAATARRYRTEIERIARKMDAEVEPWAAEQAAEDAAYWRDWNAELAGALGLTLAAPPAQAVRALEALAVAAEALDCRLQFAGRLLQGVFDLQATPPPAKAELSLWRQRVTRTSPGASLVVSRTAGSRPWAAADRWGDWRNDLALMRQLKQTFDPRGLFPDPFALLA